MSSLKWIVFFIMASDSTCQLNRPMLNIGIIYDQTVTTSITLETVEPLLHSYIRENDSMTVTLAWANVNTSSQIQAIKTANTLFDSGIHVLISALGCRQLTSVSAVTETLQIPHLALHIDTCGSSRNESYTLHLVDRFDYLPKLVTDIAVKEKWKKLNLLVDEKSYAGLIVNRLVKELSVTGISSVLVNTDLLFASENTNPANILVITDNHHLIGGLINRTISSVHKWIFVTDVILDMPLKLLEQKTNFILVQSKHNKFKAEDQSPSNSMKYTENQLIDVVKMIFVYSARNPVDQTITLNASSTSQGQLFVKWAHGLLQTVKKSCGAVQSKYGHIICNTVEYKIFGLTAAESWMTEPIGIWDPSHGLISSQYRETLFRDTLVDFGGVSLRVAIHGDTAPFSSPRKDGIGYEGFVIDMMDDLSKILNFNYILVEPEDKLYGHQLDNGTWTGMVGMVQRREVDLAAGSITITVERSSVVDYVTPFLQDGLGIIAPSPVRKADMFQAFKPFSLNVWLLIVAFGVFVSFTIIVFQYLLGPDPGCPDLKENWKQESVFLLVSSFFEQGLSWQPVGAFFRCLLCFWFAFSLLTVAIYTANLAAALTVSSPVKPINSLEDLAARPDVGVVIGYGTSTLAFFRASTITVYKTIAKKVTPMNFSPELLQLVVAGEVAWLGDVSHLKFIEGLSCGAARVGEEIFQGISQGFVIPKNSPYKKAFDLSIQKMVESGITQRFEKKWLLQKANCTAKAAEPFQSLDFSRLGGVFIVYGAFAITTIVYALLTKIVCIRVCLLVDPQIIR